MLQDTIAAISTAAVDGAISIIRLSGDDAIRITSTITSVKAKDAIFEYAKAHFGIRENEEYVKNMIDDVFEVERERNNHELSEASNA